MAVTTRGCPQPISGPSVSANVPPASAIAASSDPETSSRRPRRDGSRLSGTCRCAAQMTTAASGRLMRKMNRHDAASINHPPTNGPSAPAIPPSPDQAPMAGPRSSGRNDASMSASDPGASSAPPTPWSALAAISDSTLGATAQSSDATANQATPMTNTRRRP